MKLITKIILGLFAIGLILGFIYLVWRMSTIEQALAARPPTMPNFEALSLNNTPDYYVPKNAYKRITAPLTAEQIAIRDKIISAFPNLPVMVDIAKAESQFINQCNWLYTNENGHYTACGVFMITRTTWKRHCGDDVTGRFDVDKNIACAKIISTKNPSLSDWDESAEAWK